MQTFRPGHKAVAYNTDLSRPLCAPPGIPLSAYSFPDGPLRPGTAYHVVAVRHSPDGNQGLFLTGLRVLFNGQPIPWNSSRFRKPGQSSQPPRKAKAKRKPQPAVCA
ncbi:hypothetical protein HZ994_15535 [Akkermansiaceae bacterium]|nr:hypothetical protein HZ994_15535 [Akkermansiaceae bacterium]